MEAWPEVPESLAIYRRAFLELQDERPQAMNGAAPIPWTSVNEWAKRYGINDPDDFHDLYLLVKAQDEQWLQHAHEQQPSSDSDEQVSF